MLIRANFTWSDELREYAGPRREDVAKAMTEAWIWLEREGMIAPRPNSNKRDQIYVTQKGQALRVSAESIYIYIFIFLYVLYLLQ
jgi:hypothetical protein